MKLLIKTLLLILIPYWGLAQNPLYKDISSVEATELKIKLNSISNDTLRMTIYKDLAYYYQGSLLDSSIYYADKFTQLATKLKLKLWEAQGHWMVGYPLTMQRNYPQALVQLNKGLKLAEDPETEKKIWEIKQFSPDANPQHARLNLLANIIHDIGSLYGATGNIEEHILNYYKAIAIAKSINELTTLSIAYMNLGGIYLSENKLDSAFIAEQKALYYSNASGFNKYKGNILSFIGSVYILKENIDSAMYYHKLALQTNIAQNLTLMTGGDYLELSNDFSKMNQPDSALFYALKSRDAFVAANLPGGLIAAYRLISSAYELKKNIDSAMIYLKLAFLSTDSIYQSESDKRMQYQNIGFNEQLKVQELEREATANSARIRTNVLLSGIAVIMLIAFLLFRNNRIRKKANTILEEKNTIITDEKKRSDDLLLNILPAEVAEELKTKGSADAKQFDDVTVMFTDFKNFTQISEKLSPTELVNEIHECFKAFDNIISKHNIEKIKTIGDSYMCAGGLPVANKTNANDVVSAAMEIQNFMQQHSAQRLNDSKEVFEIRIGIHTGPVVAGIVGVKKFAYDIWGDTVNIASRMESSGEAGKVNISGSTYELVKDKFNCVHRGKIEAKNKGMIDMYFVAKS